jgi:flavin reductase (DIM6/NTAB) family NADH-FMN oxidoreductase RutF
MFHRYAPLLRNRRHWLMTVSWKPVSVVVARLQDGTYHGATLSSFSSIALHPEPLVSFSLRLPSRLADALRPSRTASSDERSTLQPTTTRSGEDGPFFSINILSGLPDCETIAHRFSQAQSNHEAALSDPKEWEYVSVPDERVARDEEGGKPGINDGIPVARKGMTTLLCRMVRSVPLWDLGQATHVEERGSEQEPRQEQGSMLFIAQVVQVLRGKAENVLVYKDRRYLSV